MIGFCRKLVVSVREMVNVMSVKELVKLTVFYVMVKEYGLKIGG